MKADADKFHTAVRRNQHWPGHLPNQEVHGLRLMLAVVSLLSKLCAEIQNQLNATVGQDSLWLNSFVRLWLDALGVLIAFERPKALHILCEERLWFDFEIAHG